MEALTVVASEPAEPDGVRTSQLTSVCCRGLDILVASALLLLLTPLLLAVAVIIRIDSPGWPVYRQTRVGLRRRPFVVNKFRTMAAGAAHDRHRDFVLALISGEGEAAGEGMFKLRRDDRITGVGRFLRRSSLDELPQLWNVLRGDMSLVGPRPPIPYEVERYPDHWFGRFSVKPGMTGLWQVGGRSELTLEEMITLDLEYVERRSFRLNLKILALTIPAVLRARGAA